LTDAYLLAGQPLDKKEKTKRVNRTLKQKKEGWQNAFLVSQLEVKFQEKDRR